MPAHKSSCRKLQNAFMTTSSKIFRQTTCFTKIQMKVESWKSTPTESYKRSIATAQNANTKRQTFNRNCTKRQHKTTDVCYFHNTLLEWKTSNIKLMWTSKSLNSNGNIRSDNDISVLARKTGQQKSVKTKVGWKKFMSSSTKIGWKFASTAHKSSCRKLQNAFMTTSSKIFRQTTCFTKIQMKVENQRQQNRTNVQSNAKRQNKTTDMPDEMLTGINMSHFNSGKQLSMNRNLEFVRSIFQLFFELLVWFL